MKTTLRRRLSNQLEKIHHQLHLDIFRHVIRDNAFGMEHRHYLPARATALERQPARLR